MNMQKLIYLQKFGALPSEALGLLRLAKAHAKKVGLSFHVGISMYASYFLHKRNKRSRKYN